MADATTPQPISRKRSAQFVEKDDKCVIQPRQTSDVAGGNGSVGRRSPGELVPSDVDRAVSRGIVASLVSRIERGELVPPLKRARTSVDEGDEEADVEAAGASGHRTKDLLSKFETEGPGETNHDISADAEPVVQEEIGNLVETGGQDGMGKLVETEAERGKLTWEQQWILAAVEGVIGKLVNSEDEEMAKLVVAHQRQIKADVAVSRAIEAASVARQAHHNLEVSRRQAAVELEESQVEVEEAMKRLENLKKAQLQHQEFLGKRIAQQRLVVGRALRQLQDAARRTSEEEHDDLKVVEDGVTKLNGCWIQLAVEQRKLHELLLVLSTRSDMA